MFTFIPLAFDPTYTTASRASALFYASTSTMSTTTMYSCFPSMTTRHGISFYMTDLHDLLISLSGYSFHPRVVSRSWTQLLSDLGENDTWAYRIAQRRRIQIYRVQPFGMWRKTKRRVFSGVYLLTIVFISANVYLLSSFGSRNELFLSVNPESGKVRTPFWLIDLAHFRRHALKWKGSQIRVYMSWSWGSICSSYSSQILSRDMKWRWRHPLLPNLGVVWARTSHVIREKSCIPGASGGETTRGSTY